MPGKTDLPDECRRYYEESERADSDHDNTAPQGRQRVAQGFSPGNAHSKSHGFARGCRFFRPAPRGPGTLE
jgi:hypothetical protein